MKEDYPACKYRKGWNTVYITDVFNPVPFYVRGNEFTQQLYHFIDRVSGRDAKPLSTFRDASYTQEIIQCIFDDHEKNKLI